MDADFVGAPGFAEGAVVVGRKVDAADRVDGEGSLGGDLICDVFAGSDGELVGAALGVNGHVVSCERVLVDPGKADHGRPAGVFAGREVGSGELEAEFVAEVE